MQINKLFRGELEERFFVIVLLCTIPYYLLNLATIFSYDDTSPLLVGIYSSLLLISFAALYLKYKRGINQIVISVFSLLLLSAFTYYLPKSGGPTGGAGYVLQNIIVLSILMTKGRLRVFITIALIVVTAVLYIGFFTFTGQIIYTRLLTDYAMNLVFISVFMIFFKFNFDNERKQLTDKNEELGKLNSELSEQAKKLQTTNEEIQGIRDSLQEKIIERTQKLEEENKKLLDYSFINAHLVRAPMANIIGITDLAPNDESLAEIKKGIKEMDDVVRKIADVLKQ